MIRKAMIWLVFGLALGATTSASAKSVHPYVDYSTYGFLRTHSDNREVETQIFLTTDDYVGFRYREIVMGSIDPVVKALEFSNEYQVKASKEEQAELVKALLDAKVFDLVSDRIQEHHEYSADLNIQIGRREKQLYFYSRPLTANRAAVDRIIFDFAKRYKLDQPADVQAATSVSEGDRQPAAHISLTDLLAQPDHYNGKRVSIEGYYEGQFEGQQFCIDKIEALNHNYAKCIWYGEPSSFADKADLTDQNHAWLRIEGVFFKGPGGHLGLWPGEIRRLTHAEVITQPK